MGGALRAGAKLGAASDGEGAWTYLDHEGAKFRRPADSPSWAVSDVLHGNTWKPYAGDKLEAGMFGDMIDAPMAGGGGAADGSAPTGQGMMAKAMLLLKAGPAKRGLYVHRKVTNGPEIARHYREQGCTNTVDPVDMHVTQLYSKAPVDWSGMGEAPDSLSIPSSDDRRTEPLGDKGAHVLHFSSPEMEARHAAMVERGASHDYDTFKTHLTVGYNGEGFDKAKPWTGPIEMGPEVQGEVKSGWKPTLNKAVGAMRVFLKAVIPGAAVDDLFPSTVTVKDHTTKHGVHVPTHTATVHKRHDPPAVAVPAPAAASDADTKLRKLAALRDRATAHEAVLEHPDGRKHLLAYVTGKSGQRLRAAVSERAKHIQRVTGADDDLRMTVESKDRLRLHSGKGEHGHVTWSGRTQRDAIMEGEHEFVGRAPSPGPLQPAEPLPLAQEPIKDVGEKQVADYIARNPDSALAKPASAPRMILPAPKPMTAEPSPDTKHFYVSAIAQGSAGKKHLVAGPYGSHEEALAMKPHVQAHAERTQPDKAHFMDWGTAGSATPIKTPLGEGWKPPA